MPQMAPLNWFMLFMMVFFCILILTSMSYFLYLKKPSMKQKESKILYYWKW
nr:ATP synthase F0 subunit 8 [Cassidinae sp. N35]